MDFHSIFRTLTELLLFLMHTEASKWEACVHHIISLTLSPFLMSFRHQILMARNLIHDGNQVWKEIVRNSYPVPWEIVMEHVEKHFFNLSSTRKQHFSPKVWLLMILIARFNEFIQSMYTMLCFRSSSWYIYVYPCGESALFSLHLIQVARYTWME